LRAVLELLATAAEGAEETSKVPFYVAGIALTAFAVIVSAIGIRAHGHFPRTQGAARGVMGLAAILVAATMATAVLTG
jgi:hypothetical protein